MGDKDHSRRHKHEKHKSKRKHHDGDEHHSKKKSKKETKIIDDDMDGDMWIEKNIDLDGQKVCTKRSHLVV